MHTDTQLYSISSSDMSNIGTNMYGGNIGSLMLCVYTCTQTHSCTVYPVAMSNICTNMYGGNIGSLMLCVYTCTQTHSCTTVYWGNFAVKIISQLRPTVKIQHTNKNIYAAMINKLACAHVHISRGKCLIDNHC